MYIKHMYISNNKKDRTCRCGQDIDYVRDNGDYKKYSIKQGPTKRLITARHCKTPQDTARHCKTATGHCKGPQERRMQGYYRYSGGYGGGGGVVVVVGGWGGGGGVLSQKFLG